MDLRVEPITEAQYEALLPMIAAYQRFYGVDEMLEYELGL
jgi:hypothetical protein